MKKLKKTLLIIPLLFICLFVFRKLLFPSTEIIQLFPLSGTTYLQLESRGEKSWLRKIDWETDKTLLKTAVPEAAYDTNSYSSGRLAPYTVMTEEVFVYRFLSNYPISHLKSEAASFQWAVNLETGEMLWHNRYPAEGIGFNFYLGCIQSEENYIINFTNNIYDYNSLYINAVDLKTGDQVWDGLYSLEATIYMTSIMSTI